MLSYNCGLCSICYLCSVQLCSVQAACAVVQCTTVQPVLLCSADVQPVLWLCANNVSYDSYQSIMQWNRLKKKYNLSWINSRLLILIFGKIERGRKLPLICPRLTLSLFNFEFIVNWRESTKKDFKLDLSLQKKIKNQDEEKKGKNIDGEAER